MLGSRGRQSGTLPPMRTFGLTTIAMLVALPPAIANDTSATLGAGGLVPMKSSSIVMESEDLRISPHEITVNYVFRNMTNRDVDQLVAFPLPEIDGGAVANIVIEIPSSDPLNFIGFTASVAGKVITPNVEVRAFLNGAEITGQLQSLHLPLSVLDTRVTAAFRNLPAADRLRIDGWVDCSLTRDSKCWPYWQSRVQYYWTQHFRAGARLEVTHRYRPVVGGGTVYRGDAPYYLADSSDMRRKYCPRQDALTEIRSRLQPRPGEKNDGSTPVLAEREIQYILTTANNWSGPIGTFHLSVVPNSPGDIVATCMPGLKRVAPARYEMTLSGFRPDRELELLILQDVAEPQK